jgi:hypothetical protein
LRRGFGINALRSFREKDIAEVLAVRSCSRTARSTFTGRHLAEYVALS